MERDFDQVVPCTIFANINMARLFGRLSSTCHEQCTTVVFVDDHYVAITHSLEPFEKPTVAEVLMFVPDI